MSDSSLWKKNEKKNWKKCQWKNACSIVRSFPASISILKWSRFYSTSELPGQSYFHTAATALHSAEVMKICFHDNFSSLLFAKILPNQQKITKSFVFTKYFQNKRKILVFPHCVALKSTLLSTSIGHVSFTHPLYSRRQNPHTIHLYFINSLLSYSVDNTNFLTPIIMPFCLKICQCCQLYFEICNKKKLRNSDYLRT